MGCEMMFILEQRLRAQAIAPEKARKVLTDIVSTMFSQRFLDELFRPQEVYTNRAARAIFDRLAHSSIMRLNRTSMDKLCVVRCCCCCCCCCCCYAPTCPDGGLAAAAAVADRVGLVRAAASFTHRRYP